jgi:hypothetical protein
MAVWQDLVSDHGFPHGYRTVKRFVYKLRGSTQLQAVGIIHTSAGEEAQSITGRVRWCAIPQSGKYRRTRLFVIDPRLQPQIGAAAGVAFEFTYLGRVA